MLWEERKAVEVPKERGKPLLTPALADHGNSESNDMIEMGDNCRWVEDVESTLTK